MRAATLVGVAVLGSCLRNHNSFRVANARADGLLVTRERWIRLRTSIFRRHGARESELAQPVRCASPCCSCPRGAQAEMRANSDASISTPSPRRELLSSRRNNHSDDGRSAHQSFA